MEGFDDSPASATPPAATQTPAPAAAPPTGQKPKVNPWKLHEEEKKRAKALEVEVAELRKLIPNEVEAKERMAEFERASQRNRELEDEIRYVKYEKSKEFQDKYREPYVKAWKRAMGDLDGVTVATADGGERPVTADDVLELVNAPLGKARQIAEEMFGRFANDVMAHRNEIRGLFDAQQTALEEARKGGEARTKRQLEEMQAARGNMQKFVTERWSKFNEAAMADEKFGHYFKPKEGDQDGNSRLAKGFELVDRAFKENPYDPRLSPEQREQVIQRHAVVRNRAAAFGRLVNENRTLQSKLEAMETELKQFKNSEPPAGGSTPAAPSAVPATARGRLHADLLKIAR